MEPGKDKPELTKQQAQRFVDLLDELFSENAAERSDKGLPPAAYTIRAENQNTGEIREVKFTGGPLTS